MDVYEWEANMSQVLYAFLDYVAVQKETEVDRSNTEWCVLFEKFLDSERSEYEV